MKRSEVELLVGGENILPSHKWVYIESDYTQPVVWGAGDNFEECEKEVKEYASTEEVKLSMDLDNFHEIED